MGTRSLTVFQHKDRTEIVVMYRQMDGYPTGHGADLKKFLEPIEVVNGYSREDKPQANGAGCLAAQVIAHFKTGVGNFYLYSAGTRDCGEEYIYTVRPNGETINLKVQAGCMTAFGLPGTKQEHMPMLYEGPISDFDPEATEAIEVNAPNDFLENN